MHIIFHLNVQNNVKREFRGDNMNTNDIIIICLAVIVVALSIGCVIAMMNSNNEIKQDQANISNTTNELTAERLSSDPAPSNDYNDDVVSVEVKYNYQAGGGYYKEVTYKDGGFRQFDLETGKLIGSSYKSDSSKLPSME